MNHDSVRTRKLLLHREEIRKLEIKTNQKGFTLIPTRLYFRKGAELNANSPSPKASRTGTSRETERRREADKEARAAIARGQRR